MSNNADAGETGRNPLEALAEEFSHRCRRGESPAISEYVDLHPELAEPIRRLFPSILMIEQLGREEKAERNTVQYETAFANPQLRRIGDFRIVREIGRGGMGIVFEAVQESLGRRVAVKVLARQALLDRRHLQRFQREAKTAGGLHHTNIVPVFGVGEQDGYHYYVMQLIRGVGLDELVASLRRTVCQPQPPRGPTPASSSNLRSARSGRPSGQTADRAISSETPPDEFAAASATVANAAPDAPTAIESPSSAADDERPIPRAFHRTRLDSEHWRTVARIGLQVSEALQYAHAQGTLHRDIKPGNVLLDREGVAWLADFGLAKALEHDDVSRTGDVVGTLRYMAPEQFAGQADHRSDIYSLGLTLYELLTLRPAHADASRTHLLAGGSDSVVARPRNLSSSIPRDLETIVLRASAQDPDERYQSAEQMAFDLRCFLESRPILARRSTNVERLHKWARRNPAVASLSTVAVVLLILVAVSTSIGFWRTKEALARESAQRGRAEAEKQKAEAYLGISLEALDRVYRRLAPDRLVESAQLTFEGSDGEQIELPTEPVLSKETAALLEDILAFYDRFAQHESGDTKLRAEAARANRRVGDIQQRLGAYEPAERAYLQAIDRYQQLVSLAEARSLSPSSYIVEIARIQNELGNVFRAWQRYADAEQRYHRARSLLQPAAKDGSASREQRFELARTYYLLARHRLPNPEAGPRPNRGPPPGARAFGGGGPRPGRFGGPPGRGPLKRRGAFRGGPKFERSTENAYLNQAIELLTQLDEQQPESPEYKYLLALCHRERGRAHRSADAATAINLLESLSQRYPTVADYRYELSESYARVDVHRLRADEFREAEERLRKALAYADALAVKHYNLPQYAQSRAHTNHKLGTLISKSARHAAGSSGDQRFDESTFYCRQAVRIQAALVEQFPAALPYQVWLIKMRHSLAESLCAAGQQTAALTTIESSIASLSVILDQQPHHRFIRRELFEHRRFQAWIREQLQRDDQ